MRLVRILMILTQFSVKEVFGQARTLIIGGQPLLSDEHFLKQWRPTFETFLTREVGSQFHPPLNFVLKPMDINTSMESAMHGMVDFMFINPSQYVCVDLQYSGKASDLSHRCELVGISPDYLLLTAC
jgi:hypothetical protein